MPSFIELSRSRAPRQHLGFARRSGQQLDGILSGCGVVRIQRLALGGSSLLKCGQDFVRSQREGGHTHPDGIGDRVGNRGAR